MIFVTVGTHEQQFNRLIKYLDILKHEENLNEEIIMQTGFSTYAPRWCEWKSLFPYNEMQKRVKEARIVITHGGPSSYIMPLQIGKIPIVVPRQKEFGEHVNNHQLTFCQEVEKRHKNIIVVSDITKLGEVIKNYSSIIKTMSDTLVSNSEQFNKNLQELVDELFREKS